MTWNRNNDDKVLTYQNSSLHVAVISAALFNNNYAKLVLHLKFIFVNKMFKPISPDLKYAWVKDSVNHILKEKVLTFQHICS